MIKYFDSWLSIALHKQYLENLRSNRIKSKELNQTLKEEYKDKLPPLKCVADEIWLYCRYLFDNVDKIQKESNSWRVRDHITNNGFEPLSKEKREELYAKLQEVYHLIRGETFYMGKKPSAIGGAIFYIACTLMKGIIHINQRDTANFIAVSEPGLRTAVKLLKKHLKI